MSIILLSKVIFLTLLFSYQFASANDSVQPENKNYTQPSANLFDSDILEPQLVLKKRLLLDLTSPTELEGKYVVVKNAEGKKCSFKPTQSDWSAGASNECLLALQVYYSANKAAKFFQAVGIQIPFPVRITIQDPNTPPLAQASSSGISFTKFEDQDIPKNLSLIVDVTFHEMTHVAQSLREHKDHMIFGRLGTSFVEGYANLFAYLLSGRTALGVDESGAPGMQAHSAMWFGRINFGRYDSIEPLTSVMVELHKYIDQNAGLAQREKTLVRYSRALMKAFYSLDKNSGLVDYFRSSMRHLDDESFEISRDDVRNKISSLLVARGFDLENSLNDGQAAGFLFNDLPMSASSYEKVTKAQEVKTPSFQAQPGMMSDRSIQWPINVVLFEMSAFQKLGPCMSEESQKLIYQTMGDPNLPNKLTMLCLKKIAGPELEIGNQSYSPLHFVIEKPGEVLRLKVRNNKKQCDPQQAPGSLFAWAFDKAGKKIGEFGFPALCR